MNRRVFLASTTAVATATLAGCFEATEGEVKNESEYIHINSVEPRGFLFDGWIRFKIRPAGLDKFRMIRVIDHEGDVYEHGIDPHTREEQSIRYEASDIDSESMTDETAELVLIDGDEVIERIIIEFKTD